MGAGWPASHGHLFYFCETTETWRGYKAWTEAFHALPDHTQYNVIQTMKNHTLTLTLTTLLLTAASLHAGETGATKPDMAEKRAAQFDRLDKNTDGALTKEEFMATKSGKSKPQQAAKAFARLDKDGNGSVSKDEFIQTPAKKPAGDKAAAADDDDAG
jgi:hypothetical protein